MHYKVTDLQMRSIFFDYYYEKGVQYKLNEFVYPQVGELFCYSDAHLDIWYGFVEYDTTWEYSYTSRRIFECECLEPYEFKANIIQPTILSYEDIGKTDFSHFECDRTVEVILTKGIKLLRELSVEDVRTLVKEKRNAT